MLLAADQAYTTLELLSDVQSGLWQELDDDETGD